MLQQGFDKAMSYLKHNALAVLKVGQEIVAAISRGIFTLFMTLMLGHLMVDMYVGLLPVFYPLLIERFAINLKTVGLVALAYTGVASLLQPLFGWVADRYGTRYIGLALIWTATTFATIGFATSFPLLLLLAAAADQRPKRHTHRAAGDIDRHRGVALRCRDYGVGVERAERVVGARA